VADGCFAQPKNVNIVSTIEIDLGIVAIVTWS
jgi:hypothetical protein